MSVSGAFCSSKRHPFGSGWMCDCFFSVVARWQGSTLFVKAELRELFPTAEKIRISVKSSRSGPKQFCYLRFRTVAEAEAVANQQWVVRGQATVAKMSGVLLRTPQQKLPRNDFDLWKLSFANTNFHLPIGG